MLDPSSSTPTTFGQQRAQALESRLKAAITKRQQLARAEFAAAAPLSENIRRAGERSAREIGRLQQELKSEQ
ncbi:MAG: hypothetical protein O2840_02685 [bacterium]|nr:hypothetical protein [bacterium]